MCVCVIKWVQVSDVCSSVHLVLHSSEQVEVCVCVCEGHTHPMCPPVDLCVGGDVLFAGKRMDVYVAVVLLTHREHVESRTLKGSSFVLLLELY